MLLSAQKTEQKPELADNITKSLYTVKILHNGCWWDSQFPTVLQNNRYRVHVYMQKGTPGTAKIPPLCRITTKSHTVIYRFHCMPSHCVKCRHIFSFPRHVF